MQFKLTSSQMNFYNKNFTLDSQIWNQGVMQIFPKVYSYEQLNNAYNQLVENHDSLRVKLVETENGVVADIKKHEHVNYRFWQLKTEEELMKKVQDFLNEPTDRYGLLVDCAVFQTPNTSGIVINAHHIVVDGYSAFVMAEHINCFLNDENFVPVIQKYPDYIEKEEKHKQSRRYVKSQEYWLKEFSANPKCNVFPTAEAMFDFSSSEINYTIPENLFCKIKSLCNESDITPASFFNAVNATYLYKKYDIESFTIGVPVLNRTTTDELNTIGLYMHLVPLVVTVQNSSFILNAQRIEDSQMNLFRHQYFTQQDIKELFRENGISVNQLFDIVSDYQEFSHNKEYEMRIPYGNSLSVPIEMHLQSFGNEKHNLKIRYRTAMFSKKEIQTMLNSIIAIAEDAVENPDKKPCDLEMISSGEKQKLLYDFNNTVHSYDIPENSTLYSLFEKTVRENADKTCITTAEKTVNFRELRRLSENLDAKIRNITNGKKSVIAVIAERSVEMYSAIYGIIRGGNAYLPIDPEYPQERIEYILKNSDAVAVAAQDKFVHLAINTPCIDMTSLINNSTESDASVPPCLAEENDTAYIIYTSGSTGNPKGAKVSHKSAVNRILWMHDKYPLEENSVILQKTPYTFDVSVWELFWWGICGGCLAFSKPGEHFLPAKILDETGRNKVTHLHFVPSVFELFLNYLEQHKDKLYKFATVKYVFLSGEALTASLVQRFYSLFNFERVTLHNLYGPTECAVDVTYYDCTPDDIDPIPIGKPIYNTQLYVVDKFINLLPIGVTGELCIGGVNVGQGYMNNPELTAEKFIDNPFGEGKIYKTGDRAYFREDGSIVFCGRIDSQIKLNGQRIEIGEIEAVLTGIDAVESAAVVVNKTGAMDMLVAFYSGKSASERLIKDVCTRHLPKYMVPSAFVHLDKLPLNTSGKLDRKVLAQKKIEIAKPVVNNTPANDTERFICETFRTILCKEDIGRNSDFFEYGGTSLSMISLLSEKGFESVTVAEFMRNPTPAKLSLVMQNNNRIMSEYLESLFVPDNATKALVVLPFAGGGAEAYSNFVKTLKSNERETAVYFIRYLHSVNECQKAAKELADILYGKEIYLYSHCVGSAVALQILKFLEKEGTVIEHYFAGASIPPAKPTNKNIWRIVPDNVLKYILIKSGAQLSNLPGEKLAELFERFREDTDFANISFAELDGKIKAPVSVILSKKDIFTKNYKQAEMLWQKYAENVAEVCFIETRSHYFQSENSEELVEILL